MEGYLEEPFSEIDKSFFETPFHHLPKRIELTKAEKELLEKLEAQKGWTGKQFLKLQRLQHKKGLSGDNPQLNREHLAKLQATCKELDITLPNTFIDFFSSQDYLSRFRTDDLLFLLIYGIVPFPEYENHFIIPFHGHSQGFYWWYLLLDRYNNHCVIFNLYNWRETSGPFEPGEPPPKYIICAESFGEFLVRYSFDLRIEEGEKISF